MTEASFRKLALSFPQAVESAHMGHPDFRVGGRIFATLQPREGRAMVKLTPEQQAQFVRAEPAVFVPVSGGWGRRGATNILLKKATKAHSAAALNQAWLNVAPRKLVEEFEAGEP